MNGVLACPVRESFRAVQEVPAVHHHYTVREWGCGPLWHCRWAPPCQTMRRTCVQYEATPNMRRTCVQYAKHAENLCAILQICIFDSPSSDLSNDQQWGAEVSLNARLLQGHPVNFFYPPVIYNPIGSLAPAASESSSSVRPRPSSARLCIH